MPQRPVRPHAGEEGAAILEFALIAPLFFMLLWGIISYGALFGLSQSITHAASEAARAAVAVDSTSAASHASTVAADRLDWLGPDQTPTITTSTAACPYDASLTCLTVDISYPWGTKPIVPSPLPDALVPDQITSTAVVQLSS